MAQNKVASKTKFIQEWAAMQKLFQSDNKRIIEKRKKAVKAEETRKELIRTSGGCAVRAGKGNRFDV